MDMQSLFISGMFYSSPLHFRSLIPTLPTHCSTPKLIRITRGAYTQDSTKDEMHARRHRSPYDYSRRDAKFQPSVWGDYFLTYASQPKADSDDKVEQRIQELKDEVKELLMVTVSNEEPLELLSLIDCIQRLGVGYHFEKEIDEYLRQFHDGSYVALQCSNGDLHTIALMFRLLRQRGHNISSNVFYKFKGPDGNFDKSLEADPRALLSLYEACHFRYRDDGILDEALTFTLACLTSLKEKLISPLRDEISRAFIHPIRKGFRRVESQNYIKIYEQETFHNEVLLRLAKLDFNRLQKIHQQELADNTEWWETLDAQKNFPFARDRLVESYVWSLLAYEPQHKSIRVILSRLFALYNILDDIYDVYGTMEELELFTSAIERWDMEVIDELPEYMQVFYKALLDHFMDIEKMMPEEVRSYRIYYARQSIKNIARAYLQQEKWFRQGHTPSMEEYWRVGWVTGAAELMFTSTSLGMPVDVATKDFYEWLFSLPNIVKACTIVFRLIDDMASYKFEQKRGHSASSLECYMKQHGVSEEEAQNYIEKLIDDAWKDINEGLLDLTFPVQIFNMVPDCLSVMDCFYDEVDLLTVPNNNMQQIVYSLLINPLLI